MATNSAPPLPQHWLMQSPPGVETVLSGRRYLYFAGTGYLGLQSHPEVIAAERAAVDLYGVHTATSRSGYGTAPPHEEVERRVAEFLGAEAALYLVTGYGVNFAIAAALSPLIDFVVMDETAHDCLREAARWLEHLQAPPVKFRHRDVSDAAEKLRKHCRAGWRPLLMADGLFPMSGSISPLAEYIEILCNYDRSMLLVDDAHGVAAIGESGKGSLEIAGIPAADINADFARPVSTETRVFRSATLSKAIGGLGGALAGDLALLQRVRSSSGWFRGASAPAAAVAAATAKALEIVQTRPELRRNLAANVRHLRTRLRDLGLNVEDSPSPVIGLSLGTVEQNENIQRRLQADGIAISFSREYTGSGPNGMLRIAVFATHTPEMIDRLISAMRDSLKAESLA
ncbi:MAG: pyridoxal phosphate-dependent aminotransferase family protein [Pirellulales bacterium]|nr:pyridoxal phosphate-dependent aminotransferase family protein [Pirellulales bacterium]